MKHKAILFSSIAAGVAFVAVFFGCAILNTPTSEAIAATDFNAGNIIDDEVFYNKNTMTVAEIQAHLDKYMPTCDMWGTGAVGSGRYINGKAVPANTTRAEYARQMRAAGKTRYHEPPYVCVQHYYENPTTHRTLYESAGKVEEGMISAAQIIYNAAQEYNINPQVLLVLLKKESYVWGDNWPLKDEYNTVMGYACPDTAPCDTKYYGFYNQVMTAAWQLNKYKSDWVNNTFKFNYRPGAVNNIYYSPTASCGKKQVYIENIATASLYIYTPYTPNDAALKAYPGTAACGSYGNRNFFMYFVEWFGSTHAPVAYKKITEKYNALGGEEHFGKSIGDVGMNKSTGAYWQNYENSIIVGSDKTGYFESNGKTREVWQAQGFEAGALGFPIGDIITDEENKIVSQKYSNGIIIGSSETNVYYSVTGGIYRNWEKNGLNTGSLGMVTSALGKNNRTGISWQSFQNNLIVGTDKYGYYESNGKIRERWQSLGFEYGALGYPTSNISSNNATGIYFQYYSGGAIVGNDQYGYWESRGKIRERWQSMKFESGVLGFPTSNIQSNSRTGITWQNYSGGVIVGNDKYGHWESRGKIRERWQSLGFEYGALGFPISNIQSNNKTGIYWQNYSGGVIVGNDKYGYWESRGKLREYWQKNGFESGKMGFPTSNIMTSGKNISQKYSRGTLTYNTANGRYTWR